MLDWSRYEAVSRVLALQGYNVIPLPPQAKGLGGSGVTFKHLNKPDSRRITDNDRREWKRTFARKGFTGMVGAYLLPHSGERRHYVIVDVDDPEYFEIVRRDFGVSPLHVERGGRVRHCYYHTKSPRRAHMLGAYGNGTVDVIATTGVVLPGSIHADGHAYELSIPVEDWTEAWTLANVPELDLEVIDRLRTKKRGTLMVDLARSDLPITESAGFIHTTHPQEFSDSVWCGSILPGTMIKTPGGVFPLAELPVGTKCFATYRDDSSPSAHVSDYKGRRHFWDMSASPKRYWTMVDSDNDDPEMAPTSGSYTAQLQSELETRLGLEVVILQDVGFLDEQIPDLPDNSTTFLVAPHGTGKTVFSKREHARASTSISVCNTQALTVANAAVLGLTAVYDEIADKASVCIPSLRRYEQPPEFFHVDEADAVNSFLHSGKVDEPLKAWRSMLHFASRSTRSLFASADLSFEDVALFVRAIRDRNASRTFRVYVRVPKRNGVRLRLCSLGKAKSEIHATLKRRPGSDTGTADTDSPEKIEPYPLFVGITTRKLAGEIAQGYRSVNASRTVDLSEVADAIDSPTPGPIALDPQTDNEGTASGHVSDLPANPHATAVTCQPESDTEGTASGHVSGVDNAFWVSGQNSRFDQAVAWLADTKRLVESHALLVTSPAVQSGVSLDPPVSRVVVLHANRDVPADAVLQIVRRARNPVDRDVLLGCPAWTAQTHRTDRAYLDDLIDRKAKTTINAIAAHFPKLTDEHSPTPDPEFARSWRISVRRLIRSYADPIGELRAAAKRHGFEVIDDTSEPDAGARQAFTKITDAARKFRERTNATQTADAVVIDETERERLSKAPKLASGERQKLDRAEIARFYDLEISPALVKLDNGGKYRARVRGYAHVMIVADFESVLAYRDHERGKGKQPSERPHDLACAWILRDMIQAIVGDFEPVLEFSVDETRPKVVAWWKQNYGRAQTFFSRLKGPAPEYETRWLCDRLRSIGGVCKTKGQNSKRRKIVSFEQVDQHAAAYASRLFAAYERRDGEEWRAIWRKQR